MDTWVGVGLSGVGRALRVQEEDALWEREFTNEEVRSMCLTRITWWLLHFGDFYCVFRTLSLLFCSFTNSASVKF